MKTLALLLFTVLVTMSCQNEKKEALKVEKGVSWALAKQRKEQISEINYGLKMVLPKNKTEPILASLNLKVTLKDVNKPLVLDFYPNNKVVPRVFVTSDSVPCIYENEHIIIPKSHLKLGENTFRINFQMGDQYLYRNDDYLYSLVVPDHARELYPCFDQPNLKAKYSLELTAPKSWKVLSATYPKKTITVKDNTTYVFATSKKMSTYLFSLVAGEFNEISQDGHRFLYRETDSVKINESLEPIFNYHQKSLDYLEAYTGYKFPFNKLDFVGIPFFQFGGMEHVGAIQYKSSSLFFENYMPKMLHWNRANVIAHETSHMWFGNLVTMDWFDDVWLKEVFANFIAAKIVNPSFPEINHDLLNLITKAPSAYNIDRTQGTNAIRQKLDNLSDAGSLYGAIIYNKAPIMMRQLELILGEDKFKQGLQEYIKTYANDNANWDDLITIFNTKTTVDLNTWSDVWVNQTGRPVFEDAIVYENDRIKSVTLSQKAEDGSNNIWLQKYEVALIYKDSIAKRMVNIVGKSQELKELINLPKPEAIVYNSNGYGYGVFPIDTITALNTYQVKDEVIRAQNYINTYENTLSGNIPVHTAMETFLSGFEHETNDLILGVISGDFSSLYWHFLNPEERANYQEKIAARLWVRLNDNLSIPTKKSLFSAFTGLAYQGESLDKLYHIWSRAISVENLKLNEKDYTGLAMKLALYNHPKHDEVLKLASTQISNQDDKDLFNFLLPALSQDTAVRRDLFFSFRDVTNRTNSNWVAAANGLIHHPLRQEEAIKYMSLSLELLEEVKETSDLFFPKKWLESTIGKYQSKEAKLIVDTYLDKHPNLNMQLKAKLLQTVDHLMRYQKMLNN
ncbi:peptidase M1 [Tamlana agarivorans]|uniref:Peptidase M1 n=2 Tax=Pseudotamlana agarivorans TaxID=481183 RepID=A0ACC5U940_9FLAO|nr:peptidase M1 [Tamlana agarivorans]